MHFCNKGHLSSNDTISKVIVPMQEYYLHENFITSWKMHDFVNFGDCTAIYYSGWVYIVMAVELHSNYINDQCTYQLLLCWVSLL